MSQTIPKKPRNEEAIERAYAAYLLALVNKRGHPFFCSDCSKKYSGQEQPPKQRCREPR